MEEDTDNSDIDDIVFLNSNENPILDVDRTENKSENNIIGDFLEEVKNDAEMELSMDFHEDDTNNAVANNIKNENLDEPNEFQLVTQQDFKNIVLSNAEIETEKDFEKSEDFEKRLSIDDTVLESKTQDSFESYIEKKENIFDNTQNVGEETLESLDNTHINRVSGEYSEMKISANQEKIIDNDNKIIDDDNDNEIFDNDNKTQIENTEIKKSMVIEGRTGKEFSILIDSNSIIDDFELVNMNPIKSSSEISIDENKKETEIIKSRIQLDEMEDHVLEPEILDTSGAIRTDNLLESDTNDKNVTTSLEDQESFMKHGNCFDESPNIPKTVQKLDNVTNFFTVHIQRDNGTVRNQIVTVIRSKHKKPFLGGYRHKLTGIEYHNASAQTRPRPRPHPSTELFSRDTQTFQVRHQKVNTNNTTSTQMTGPGIFISNINDKLIVPGKYVTADEFKEGMLENVIIIQKYYRRWLAKQIVDNKRKQRDERIVWEQQEKELKIKEKEERIIKEYERRMHPKTRTDFDLLYNGLEKWRQEQLAEINNANTSEAEKKAAKLILLDEETELLAAIDRLKIDRNQQNKGEEVQRLLNKAAAPKTWKDDKGKKIEMETPYTIRSRELLGILNSLNMQYLTSDERLDVLLTLKHTIKEHDCKLTRDIIDLVDREADLIMRNVKDTHLSGLRKRIVTLFLQYCKTPTFNPEISLLLRVPPDPSVLVGDINYCKYCGRYLLNTEFSLSTKSLKLTICKSCARKENQSRKRQDYSHYRRILKDLQMDEQYIDVNSKIAFVFKQNDIKTLIESVWDSKSILSECEDLDELIFVRWNCKEHWSPWNTIFLTKEEAEAHKKVVNLSETYSHIMIHRINQKHVIAKNMFESLDKMTDKINSGLTKSTIKA